MGILWLKHRSLQHRLPVILWNLLFFLFRWRGCCIFLGSAARVHWRQDKSRQHMWWLQWLYLPLRTVLLKEWVLQHWQRLLWLWMPVFLLTGDMFNLRWLGMWWYGDQQSHMFRERWILLDTEF
ncbi:hypothetical protein SGCOL_001413 [Colletotrichum sp. CLE4]